MANFKGFVLALVSKVGEPVRKPVLMFANVLRIADVANLEAQMFNLK